MELLELLDQTYSEAIALSAKLTPEDLERPTGCPEWNVRALLNHILYSSATLSRATAGLPAPEPGVDMVGGDAPAAVAATLEDALALWRRPGSLDGMCDLPPFGQTPSIVAGNIALVDLATHLWDLRRALGQLVDIDPVVAEVSLGFAKQMVNDELRAKVGFEPAVDPGPDPSASDRLVAFLGRRP